MAKVIVGIDLGTTFSAIAYINELTQKAEIIVSPEQERTTASAVLFKDEGGVEVGELAKRNAMFEPDKVVEFVKREMGKSKDVEVSAGGWSFEFSGKKYSAQEISAYILKKLKNDAEVRLGMPITDAVITCPAYFGDAERSATKEAGIIAGFNVLAIIDEPVAAALAYGLDKIERDQTVFVFDLGGGTFDVVVLEIKGRRIREIAVNGNHRKGGKDWDDEIVNYAAGLFTEKFGVDPTDDPSSHVALRLEAVKAKIELSRLTKAIFICSHAGNTLHVELTREKFEELTKKLVDDCQTLCEIVLGEANKRWQDIDTVLLVGGSTRMPMIKKMIAALSGKIPNEDLNPDECVAEGAAWHGAMLGVQSGDVTGGVAKMLSGISVGKVTSHNYGAVAERTRDGVMRNFLMIPKSTAVPCEKTEEFRTREDDQRSIELKVMEGGTMEEDDTCDPTNCENIGKVVLDNLPSHPKGSPIQITYRWDESATLVVNVKDVGSGKAITASFERPCGLSEQELNRARRDLQTVNVTA